MAFRASIPDFEIANQLYAAASVTFYEADENGAATAVLATLFRAPIGSQTVSNPQTLDAFGKFPRPVYVDGPVIAEVVSGTVGTHTTGVIAARGRWRDDWITATRYFVNDSVVDPATGSIYKSTNDFISSASVAADVAAGNLETAFDATAAQDAAAAAIAAAVDDAVVAAVASAEAAVFSAGLAPVRIGTEQLWPGITPPSGWLNEFGQAVDRIIFEDLMEVLTAAATASRVAGNSLLTSVSVDLRNLGLVGSVIEGTGIPPGTTVTAIAETTITLSANVTGTGAMDIRIFPYGNGNGSTTFNIPDAHGIFLFGRDDMGGTAAGRISFAESGVHGDRLGKIGGAQAISLTGEQNGPHDHDLSPGNVSVSVNNGTSIHRGGTVNGSSSSGGAETFSANAHLTTISANASLSGNSGESGEGAPHRNVPPAGGRNVIIFTGVIA